MAHPAISNIELKWKSPKRSSYTPNEAAGDATRKLLTGIFRSGVNTSEDLTWELRQEIQTNAEELDWKLSIYCAGQLEKTSEKIKNRDGSKSVNTEKMAHLYWDRGASAILLDKNDTIGQFVVTVDRYDSMFRKVGELLPETALRKTKSRRWQPEPAGVDYVLTGNFRGQPLHIFFNATDLKAWIYTNEKLQGIFQSDIIYVDTPPLFGPKPEATPVYLLYPNATTTIELTDCIRLAALSRLVATSVAKNSWER